MIATALLATARIAAGQATPTPSSSAAEHAVAEFYAWYVPIWQGEQGPHLRALRERRAQFAAPLVAALEAEAAATAQGGEEVDGLDADPFLNAQDPCERYRPVHTERRGDRYLVDVLGEGGCRGHTTPDVIVEVAWRQRRPVFTNFLYSRTRGDDLRSRLTRLAAQRRRNARAERDHR